jgi:hypothetical protein
MSPPLNASQTLNREFLPLRAKLLEVAAILDRLDHAPGDAAGDPRMKKVRQAIEILHAPQGDLAERLQLLFSIPYDENWIAKFELAVGSPRK